jgi:hypothetical protein
MSNNATARVFPLDSKPFGTSYEDWTVKFWQWLISIPADRSPVTDQTGERCGEKQGDLPVFFLAFSFRDGARVHRTCTLPTGKAILIPVNVVEVSFAEFPGAKDDDLHKLATDDESSNPFVSLSVDGKEFNELKSTDGNRLPDLKEFRVHSRAFELTLPDHPIFKEARPGTTRAVSDGYWVILEPLQPGSHDIHFEARLTNSNGIDLYKDDVKYTINV